MKCFTLASLAVGGTDFARGTCSCEMEYETALLSPLIVRENKRKTNIVNWINLAQSTVSWWDVVYAGLPSSVVLPCTHRNVLKDTYSICLRSRQRERGGGRSENVHIFQLHTSTRR
jgi:hypothetical protein